MSARYHMKCYKGLAEQAMLVRLLIALLVWALAATGAAAVTQRVKSMFTTIDLKSCRVLKKHHDGYAWRCRGLTGYPVYVAEGDLRYYVSIGNNGETRRAAGQTLNPFNTIFKGDASRTAIEWRFTTPEGRTVPYATIVRYFTSNDTGKGQVFVVTRVTATETCHVAYVDALANEDAIKIARRVADERALRFDCNSQPTIEGATGKSPM